jgi:hypothetical protein
MSESTPPRRRGRRRTREVSPEPSLDSRVDLGSGRRVTRSVTRAVTNSTPSEQGDTEGVSVLSQRGRSAPPSIPSSPVLNQRVSTVPRRRITAPSSPSSPVLVQRVSTAPRRRIVAPSSSSWPDHQTTNATQAADGDHQARRQDLQVSPPPKRRRTVRDDSPPFSPPRPRGGSPPDPDVILARNMAIRSLRHGRRVSEPAATSSSSQTVSRRVTSNLAKIMASGLPSDQVMALREAFNPDFESTSFALAVPSLDDKFAKSLKQTGNKAVEKQEKLLMSHQFKLLDLARPLLNALSITNEESTKEALESTLSLWAVAFNDLSKSRRKTVLATTDPGFTHILSKPENFSRYKIGQLFGRRFSD